MVKHNTFEVTDTSPWEFVLYINGESHESKLVERRLRQLCEHFLGSDYIVHVIDIMDEDVTFPPGLLAVPTIVRTAPLPERRVIGNLVMGERAIEGLGLDQFQDFVGEFAPFKKTDE